jgi:hypothetical protein
LPTKRRHASWTSAVVCKVWPGGWRVTRRRQPAQLGVDQGQEPGRRLPVPRLRAPEGFAHLAVVRGVGRGGKKHEGGGRIRSGLSAEVYGTGTRNQQTIIGKGFRAVLFGAAATAPRLAFMAVGHFGRVFRRGIPLRGLRDRARDALPPTDFIGRFTEEPTELPNDRVAGRPKRRKRRL